MTTTAAALKYKYAKNGIHSTAKYIKIVYECNTQEEKAVAF